MFTFINITFMNHQLKTRGLQKRGVIRNIAEIFSLHNKI